MFSQAEAIGEESWLMRREKGVSPRPVSGYGKGTGSARPKPVPFLRDTILTRFATGIAFGLDVRGLRIPVRSFATSARQSPIGDLGSLTAARSEVADNFATRRSRQADKRGEVDVFADESNGSIAHREVSATHME